MGVSVVFDLFQPVSNMVEGVSSKCFPSLPGDIVDQQGSDGATIVGASDRPEVLLTGGVPDLEFDVLIIDGDSFCSELDADGDIVGDSGLVFDELEYDAGFSYA